jgi:hypothetical protein
MSDAAISEGLDKLAALTGEVVPAAAWSTHLGAADPSKLLTALIAATRALVLPDWVIKRPDDHRPQDAIAAAEAWMAAPTAEAAAHAKEVAKACTAARGETLGYSHHIAEAARAAAWVAGGKAAALWEGLVSIEEELLARIKLTGEYHRALEPRRLIVAALRPLIAPAPAAISPGDAAPVPYAASGNFVVGQRLNHAKFGEVVVTAAGDKWIDAQLADGSVKRLAQRPK